ncbi:MAG TPA: ribosome-associated translation inhibitor RaiA [Flavobacteriales bacterium]|jgi:putative sigma-54 modulation protein|nr:ribosome-associated translation inhibitor RaiA [Flavobacteriales bacterium]HPH81240.1 ribosome-associated translation inhibitor RaiA [Flavobacteriales bacterium]
MKVNIQSVHFNADKKLLDFIELKLQKLATHYDKIIESEVTLRLDNASNNENKIVEIRLHVPGNDLFAKRQCATFEEAVDESIDALRNQMIKHKEKIRQV